MVSSPHRIRVSNDVYDALDILRHTHDITFSQAICKYIPMPFFDSEVSVSQPVPIKVSKAVKIGKQKYNPTADLEDFERNRSKSVNTKVMPFDTKVKVVNGEYDDKTKEFLTETCSPYYHPRKVKV
jgi:hypothetical protein